MASCSAWCVWESAQAVWTLECRIYSHITCTWLQIVNIEADNTVAFSQWALGSVEEEEAEEQLPATVTCKKSRRSSTLTAPSSAGKTPSKWLKLSAVGHGEVEVASDSNSCPDGVHEAYSLLRLGYHDSPGVH